MGTIFNPNVREGERMERKFPRTEIHNLGIPREVVLFLEIPVRPQISVKFSVRIIGNYNRNFCLPGTEF